MNTSGPARHAAHTSTPREAGALEKRQYAASRPIYCQKHDAQARKP